MSLSRVQQRSIMSLPLLVVDWLEHSEARWRRVRSMRAMAGYGRK
jgi:hypothetical protein